MNPIKKVKMNAETVKELEGQFIQFTHNDFLIETDIGNLYWTPEDNVLTPYNGNVCNFAMTIGTQGKETGKYKISEKCNEFVFKKKRK